MLRFRRGTAALPADARPALEAALQELAAAPDAVVEVHGHTDDEGVRERNLELALARAGAVRAWLIIRGIDPARIRMIGHSPDQSAGAASLSAARASNRRAELFLIR